MTATTSKTFKSGNSEAVRLPREIGFGIDVEVEVERKGDVIVISRKRSTPQELIAKLNALPKPSRVQKRPPFIAPVRKGL